MVDYFPDAPGRKFQLDVDGTQFVQMDAAKTAITADRTMHLPIIVKPDTTTPGSYENFQSNPGTAVRFYLALIFPELRDITHYFIECEHGGGNYRQFGDVKSFEVSTDTTDGIDGTWVNLADPVTVQSMTVSPQHRTQINAIPGAAGVRAVRLGCGSSASYSNVYYGFVLMHMALYGSLPVGQNPDRLRMWRSDMDAEIDGPYFDFGDMVEGTSEVKTFRVKNNSATLTAGTILVSKQTQGFVDVDNSLEFSLDGITWAASVPLPDLAPGAISPTVQIRRSVTTGAETLQIAKETRIAVEAATWV